MCVCNTLCKQSDIDRCVSLGTWGFGTKRSNVLQNAPYIEARVLDHRRSTASLPVPRHKICIRYLSTGLRRLYRVWVYGTLRTQIACMRYVSTGGMCSRSLVGTPTAWLHTLSQYCTPRTQIACILYFSTSCTA